MKQLFHLTSILILFLLSACSKMTPEEALAKLRTEMTVEEVVDELGSPDADRDLGNNKRVYVYEVSEGYVMVFFVTGRVESFNRTDRIVFR